MLCENCKQNQATVHLQKIINGEKIENHLCSSCAEMSKHNIPFDSLFQDFMSSFFNQQLQSISGGTKVEKTLKCPNCSMTYEDFRNTGLLGCSTCYNSFRNELNIVFKSMQTSNKHQGKIPKKSENTLILKRELENLKSELKHSIEIEEYEEAARLRDEIKKLMH